MRKQGESLMNKILAAFPLNKRIEKQKIGSLITTIVLYLVIDLLIYFVSRVFFAIPLFRNLTYNISKIFDYYMLVGIALSVYQFVSSKDFREIEYITFGKIKSFFKDKRFLIGFIIVTVVLCVIPHGKHIDRTKEDSSKQTVAIEENDKEQEEKDEDKDEQEEVSEAVVEETIPEIESKASGPWTIFLEDCNVVLGETTAQELLDAGWKRTEDALSLRIGDESLVTPNNNVYILTTKNVDYNSPEEFVIDDFFVSVNSDNTTDACSISGATSASTLEEIYNKLGMPNYFFDARLCYGDMMYWIYEDVEANRFIVFDFFDDGSRQIWTLKFDTDEEAQEYIDSMKSSELTSDEEIFRKQYPEFFDPSIQPKELRTLEGGGLYDAEGNLLCTWAESGIDIEKNYSFREGDANYHKTDITSPYYVLTEVYPTARKIVLPKGIISIGYFALIDIPSITSIEFPEGLKSIPEDSCVFQDAEEIILPEGIKEIYLNSYEETEMIIPDGVETLHLSGFNNKNIDIPDSVTDLSIEALCDLEELNIPNGVKTLSVTYCDSLSTLILPDGVEDLRVSQNENLFEMEIPNTVKKINCFGSSFKNIVIPDSITELESKAFRLNLNLETITFPSTLTKIGEGAFQECNSLLGVSGLPEGIEIETEAFSQCEKLEIVDIPENAIVGDRAFEICKNLKSVNVPASATISESAFERTPFEGQY